MRVDKNGEGKSQGPPCDSPQSDLHLVTDGKSIYLEDQHDRIVDILKNAKQPMFVVCVSDQVRRLDDSPRKPAKAEAAAAGSRRSARGA